MRVLYCAIDQRVPGTTGGAIHVAAVANGLAALGHEVHVLARPGRPGFPDGRVHWHHVEPPLGMSRLRLARGPRVLALARAVRPDIVIERYHNFGGEGIRAAARTGAVAVLEVNAPVVDYAGSPKHRLDRALLLEPMRRWRDWQCRHADLLITPVAAIVPAWVPRDRVVEIEWGADTDRFHPGAPGCVLFARTPGHTVAVFAGAFRRWHGAIALVDAIGRLRRGGCRTIDAVLIGDGPELPAARRAAAGLDGVSFTGAIPHAEMPAALAAADIGAAPFDVAAHPPLSLGFYWSPLKILEYMASGLPVAAPAIEGLRRIITDGRDGILYDPLDDGGLARALERLADPGVRHALGAAGRERVVQDFSWSRHCTRLAAEMEAALERRRRRMS